MGCDTRTRAARTMAPKGNKAKGKARAAATTPHAVVAARDSSDDDDDDDDGEDVARRAAFERRPKPPFDKDAILATVLSLAAPNRLPAVFGAEETQQAWHAWHAATPTTLDEVPTASRLTQVKMPKKCEEPAEQAAPPAAAKQQVELLTYSNDDGRKLTMQQLQRTAAAVLTRALTTDDLPLNSIVALKAPPASADAPVGECTPFLVADVVEVDTTGGTAAAAAASSSVALPVSRILVHYRMPYSGASISALPTNDPSKAWHLACLCRGKYNLSHERYVACKARKAEAPVSAAQETTKFLEWLTPNTVLETKLELTSATKHLTAGTKRRLVEDLPANKGLAAQLGVKPTEQKQPQVGAEAFT
jgi:hypothetical protein